MWLGPLTAAVLTGLAVLMQLGTPGVGLRPIFIGGDLFFLVMAYFSFTAGRGLLGLKADAVKMAKLYCETLFAGCLIVAFYFSKLLFYGEIPVLPGLHFIKMTVGPAIYAMAWHSYLSGSARVRNTYP
jgi:hypothetical protein